MSLHPVLSAASEGRLPAWAEAGEERLAHMNRVAELLGAWASAMGGSELEVGRWRAAGMLHDVVREADPGALRHWDRAGLAAFPDDVVHGPAAATRLRREGVDDEDFLRAIAYHTIGHPDFGRLGEFLYAADFLEPGRVSRREWRASLRERMPEELGSVLSEVAAARVGRLLELRRPLPAETAGFWNGIVC